MIEGERADATSGIGEGYGYGTHTPHMHYVPVPSLERHLHNLAGQCHARSCESGVHVLYPVPTPRLYEPYPLSVPSASYSHTHSYPLQKQSPYMPVILQ